MPLQRDVCCLAKYAREVLLSLILDVNKKSRFGFKRGHVTRISRIVGPNYPEVSGSHSEHYL